jgi:hypothetical protein
MTPILPKTAALLKQLAVGLEDEEYIFAARRTRDGKRVALG